MVEPGEASGPLGGSTRRLSAGLIPASELLRSNAVMNPPEVFYGQSASVVSFLISHQGGAARFLEFARGICDHGLSASLKKSYGFNSVEDFEAAWLSSLLQ